MEILIDHVPYVQFEENLGEIIATRKPWGVNTFQSAGFRRISIRAERIFLKGSDLFTQMDMIFELLDEKFDDVDKNGDGKINMFYIQGPPNEDMSICYDTVKARIAESKYKDTLVLLEQQ